MSYRIFISKLLGFSATNEGTNHWLKQRFSSIFLIPLTILFVFPLAQHIGHDYQEIMSLYQNPFRSAIAFLFLLVTAIHLRQGLQVVIEDYIHSMVRKETLLVCSTVLFVFFTFIAIYSFTKIVFST